MTPVTEYQGYDLRLKDLRKAMRELEDEKDKWKGRILQLLGNKTRGIFPHGLVVYAKTVHRGAYHVEPTSYVNITIK